VRDTGFFKWDKSSNVGGEFGVSGGFDLKEFFFTTESFTHDSSSSVHHLLDLSVFFDNTFIHSLSIFSFSFHGSSSLHSVTKFSLFVNFFFTSGFENWVIDFVKSLVFSHNSFSVVNFSGKSIHVSSARISNFIMSSFDFSLSGSQVTSDFSDHRYDVINIIAGGELDLDGINKGGTKFRFSEFSKYI